MSQIDDIRLQVMWNRLISVVEEQAMTLPAVAAPPCATYWAKYFSVAAPLAIATDGEFCEPEAAPKAIAASLELSNWISTFVAAPAPFATASMPVVVSTVGPISK